MSISFWMHFSNYSLHYEQLFELILPNWKTFFEIEPSCNCFFIRADTIVTVVIVELLNVLKSLVDKFKLVFVLGKFDCLFFRQSQSQTTFLPSWLVGRILDLWILALILHLFFFGILSFESNFIPFWLVRLLLNERFNL